MAMINTKHKRQNRVRTKLKKTVNRPRLIVFRSVKHIYAQIVDRHGKVLAAAGEKIAGSPKNNKPGTKIERAKEVGSLIAKRALSQKITRVVFDRGSYRYHGRVKTLAEAARTGGIQF